MKILIIGGGSIGHRHAKNAIDIGADVALFDTDQHITQSFAGTHNTPIFADTSAALAWQPSATIIATPHHLHIDLATKAVNAGSHVLIEKPLSHSTDGVDELIKLCKDKNIKAHVVCNMRYHAGVQILREHLPKIGKPLYARAQYGNYLPNMRPDADYKKLYCAHKAQGGGVILDAIHEINYLSWLFGKVDSLICDADKRSELDIDVEDYAAINLTHANNMRSEVHLDYLQQFKRRGCEIIGEDGTLIWKSEGKAPEHCIVRIYDKKTESWTILHEEDALNPQIMYKNMMKDFLNTVSDKATTAALLNIEDAYTDLRTCIAAHKSAQTAQRQKVD